MSQTSLRLRVVPRYPASVTATDGIKAVRSGVDLVVKSDYSNLVQVADVPNPDKTFMLAWDSDIDNYQSMSFTNIINNIQDAVIGPPLAAIDATNPGADQVIYFTGEGEAATYTSSDFVRSISNAPDAGSFADSFGAMSASDYDPDSFGVSAFEVAHQIDVCTSAISSKIVPALVSSFMTSGYETAGDGGHCLFERINAPGTPQAWHRQDASGAWFAISAYQGIYPEMFGAKADPAVDDTAAIQAALDFSLIVNFRDRNYYLTGSLTWKPKHQLIGALRVNGSSTSDTGGTRLVFTGSGDACFIQSDKTVAFTYGGMRGITVRSTGDYGYFADVYSALGFMLIDGEFQTTSMTTNGLRSQKINPGDSSWLNVFINFNIILPTGSTGKPIDEDWSDSVITGNTFGGGLGSFSRGYGNKVTSNNFERASNAGLTLKAKYTGVGSLISGNFYDANTNYGIVIDTSDDPSTSNYQVNHVIVGNKFRTVDATSGATGIADIYLRPDDSSRIFNGPTIAANSHSVSAVPQLLHDPAKWGRVIMGLDHNLNVSVTPFSTEVFDLLAYVGYKGINVPNGIAIVRGSYTQFGMGSVAGFFGAPGTGGAAGTAGVQIGSISGAAPFIGASRTGAGVATDLRILTDATERLRLHSGGSYLRPAVDSTMTLGQAANRFLNAFAVTLNPGAGLVKWTSASGSPEGVLTGPVGSMYTRTDGASNTTLYVKETGSGNTGWTAK